MDEPEHDEEAEITRLEEQIPYLAAGAFRAARQQALDSGASVVEASGDALYETYPDGTRRFIKNLPSDMRVSIGSEFTLR